ncbi:protein kinase [Streptomyces polygonati]|uniref:non-specific serine/threonine protein kinase n=1 Tax=Streptomyces polygonati TaxID=1617087 RepID=A0ABV8HN01_9ACTN
MTEDRFREEGVLLARLRHPNLVTVYDAGRDAQGSYLVMDHIAGTTLRERIAAGPLRYDDVVQLGSRLSSALAHVHAADVVHRDMKLSNVLLNADGEPFLADFGVSRSIDEPTRAEAGTLVGTVAYMAPEQILGNGSGPASDVYALGLVLLECLKGAREFQGALPEAGYARLMRSPEIGEDLPEPLRPILEAMTRSDPRSRPVAADCVALFRSAPDTWMPPPSTAHEAKTPRADGADTDPPQSAPVRRRRLPLALAATSALAVIGTTGIVLAATDGGRHTPDAVDHRPASATSSATRQTPTSPARTTGWAHRSTTTPPADPSSAPDRAATVAQPADPGHEPGPPPNHGQSAGHGRGLTKGKHKTKN